MDISLIVCTRDRDRQLERTLHEIARIDTGIDWELVVVDNASSDATEEVIEEFVERTRIEVRHVFEPKVGLSRARNRGCRSAMGQVIGLTDDDCYPARDYLDQMIEVFDRHDVGFAGGRILLHDPEDAPVTVREASTAEPLPPRSFPWAGFIQGANMAFRSEVFRDLGGFDESIGAGTPFPAADIEFCARASDRGWRGGYFPGPTVFHHHGRRGGERIRRLRADYARGRGAYYAKGMLDYEHTARAALQRWYWSARHETPAEIGREVVGALRYLARRLGHRWNRTGS